jgi:NhaA family Na+:H+ antiporter
MSQDSRQAQISPEPPAPVRIIESFERFFQKSVRGSYPLFIAALAALLWANLSPGSYHGVWETQFSFSLGPFHMTKPLQHWIDEALMSVFFFTVGLEIKREILVGELASFKQALPPIAAALGGMLFPAVIYLIFNYDTPAAKGWGIPMATDIAFSLAVLAALRDRVPAGLRIFLSAFAIADDLGAVLVIAIFYTETIVLQNLLLAVLALAGLALANILWIRSALVYALLGITVWLAVLGSGIHATVAGVMVAMFIPAKAKYKTDTFVRKVNAYLDRFQCKSDDCSRTIPLNKNHLDAVLAIEEACYDVATPLQRLEDSLQSWVALLILPLFALANAGLVLTDIEISRALLNPVTLGIVLGLVLGKPLGISTLTYAAFKTFNAPLPSGVLWRHIIGASMLGGIGFTMSLFISGLCFASGPLAGIAKLGIITGSLMSALSGLVVLMVGNMISGAPDYAEND